MSLIVRLTPYTDESLHGFLRRVSQRNLAPGVKAFLGSFGIKFRSTFSEPEVAQLAGVLGVDAADLAIRQFSPDNRNPMLRLKYQRIESAKFCPACMGEQPYQRMGWAHVLVTACPRHGILLRTSCAACGQGVSADGSLDHCSCGHSYAKNPAQPASDQALALSALLLGVDHVARQSLPPTWSTGLPSSDTAELLCLLGKHFIQESPGGLLPKPSRGRAADDDVIAWGRAGFDLLLQWPSRFNEALGDRLASTEGPGLAKRLGGWYRALHQRYVDPAHDCIREALVQHLTRNFDGHLNLRLSTIDPQHLQEKCWLTSEEAGRLIGIGSELVRSAVTTGEIDGKVTVRGKNRFVSIHKKVVERVRHDRLAHYDATTTRKQLGVSKILFERLMQAGALRKQTKKERPPLVSGEFLVKDVDVLIGRLTSAVSGRTTPEEQLIGLQDITVRRGISSDRICSVLQKILALEIRPIEHNQALHGLAGLRFDLADIKDELHEEPSEPMLTITELVKLRKWKHENVVSWIRQGLLRTATVAQGEHLQTRIPLSALLDFMAEYAVLAELAGRTGTKSLWLLRALMPANVKAVRGQASSGTQRGLLLSIDQLVAAAQWNKKKDPKIEAVDR
ncbi:TniQ family protein [Pseudomonas sp. LP_7_YM]|uniref:TniQ family protein n=1 Tax=Pseudomonas sp. LP_7_YM TaxID=2485137 RepID=UPI00105D2BD0|nr:TniQ family protein [Pseudomonas sp. LP_7_YM]TDV58890.1 TniQ protein [Pseudomonas sp. LP_7_YM]